MLKKMIVVLCFLMSSAAWADITIPMHLTTATGEGKEIGTITVQENKYGLLFIPHLAGLTPGIHGFHVHENPSCADKGMAAGGHLDPNKTGHHLGPYNDNGHLGDLPALTANADGSVSLPVLAPRLKMKDIEGHSLMIHDGADNYSDNPPMGGGGARFACGVIK